MESLIEKAKKNIVKFGNKVSDAYYRDKWDRSQVNTALFADTPEEAVGTFSNFEQQIKDYRDNEQSIEETIETPVVEKISIEDTILSKVNLNEVKEDLPNHMETDVPNGLTESLDSISDPEHSDSDIKSEEEFTYCYYVIVKHKSDSTKAIVRSCDNEHVAVTSDDGLINRLEYDFCPKCGKRVEYLETEIE